VEGATQVKTPQVLESGCRREPLINEGPRQRAHLLLAGLVELAGGKVQVADQMAPLLHPRHHFEVACRERVVRHVDVSEVSEPLSLEEANFNEVVSEISLN